MKATNGVKEYNDLFIKRAGTMFQAKDPDGKFMLKGFYNYVLNGRTSRTAYVYMSNVATFIEKANIEEAKDVDLDAYTGYFALMSAEGYTTSAMITTYHALRAYSAYLKAKKVCQEDYMGYVKRPKPIETEQTKEKRENGYLTEDEIYTFLNNIKRMDGDRYGTAYTVRNYAIAMLFLGTGIREAALYKLDVSDVDIERGKIKVAEKGEKRRTIQLPGKTLEALKEWLKLRHRFLKEGLDTEALFVSRDGTRLSAPRIWTMINKAGAVIPGKNISPHKLRATFGTQLYNQTGDVYFVQQCMGHASPTTTTLYVRGQKDSATGRAAGIMDTIF